MEDNFESISHNIKNWNHVSSSEFWGEIASREHVLQIYQSEEILINTLTGFVGDGINAGESVIVIATEAHLDALNKRLKAHAINIPLLISEGVYLPVNAEKTLTRFMADNWPDEEKFNGVITELLLRVSRNGRQVRAFAEMVALLWQSGQYNATLWLEQMWANFCEQNNLSLFHAYPQNDFSETVSGAFTNVCACHSKLISGHTPSLSSISYMDL